MNVQLCYRHTRSSLTLFEDIDKTLPGGYNIYLFCVGNRIRFNNDFKCERKTDWAALKEYSSKNKDCHSDRIDALSEIYWASGTATVLEKDTAKSIKMLFPIGKKATFKSEWPFNSLDILFDDESVPLTVDGYNALRQSILSKADQKYLNLKVEYIGKSQLSGGTSERIHKHDKSGRLVSFVSNNLPDRQVLVLQASLTHLQRNDTYSIGTTLSVAEATLINFFKPKWNQHDKESLSSKKLNFLNRNGIKNIQINCDFESVNTFLYTDLQTKPLSRFSINGKIERKDILTETIDTSAETQRILDSEYRDEDSQALIIAERILISKNLMKNGPPSLPGPNR